MIDLPRSWKRWATADREAIGHWSFGGATLLGDAAHPTSHYVMLLWPSLRLVLPGEWAPLHRHMPNVVRVIVEGEVACTTVDGEKCPMGRGDLILTPTGLWHEHGHDGTEPVVWLDVLDLPLVHYMETSYAIEGRRQAVQPGRGDPVYAHGGLLPTPVFTRSARPYPMLRYPWKEARAALLALGQDRPALEAVQITYVNPETGGNALNILGFHALMLRPGQTLRLPARSPAGVFHVIEGGVAATIDDSEFTLDEADTCCAPGYTAVALRNRHADRPAFVFIADETPLHRKLGVFEVRD